jgi:quercetin dioxygenase-like cupin family protein
MDIERKAPTAKGPADWFTGDVWIDPLVRSDDRSTLNVAAVHFTPGARTAWHTHDGGQTLYVTEGEGRVQSRGEAAVTILPGEVVRTPSGEWHWHGAAPDHFMTHLSLTHGPATWGDHVTDDDYHASETTPPS